MFSVEKTLGLFFGEDIDPGTDITLGGETVKTVDGCSHVGIPLPTSRRAELRLVDEKVAACRLVVDAQRCS